MSACCGEGRVSSNVSYMKPMVVATVVWEWNTERREIPGLQGVGEPVIWLHALSLHPFPLCSALHGRLNYLCQTDFLTWLQVQCYQLKRRVRLCQPRKVGEIFRPASYSSSVGTETVVSVQAAGLERAAASLQVQVQTPGSQQLSVSPPSFVLPHPSSPFAPEVS